MKLPDAPTMTFISLQHTLKAQLHCIISSHLNHAALLIAELVCQRARREVFFFFLPVSNCDGKGGKKSAAPSALIGNTLERSD